MPGDNISKSTIMFTDIVGYSAMVNKDQDHAMELLSMHDKIIEPIIKNNNGKIIKKIGDSIFAEFLTPKASIKTARNIQITLNERNVLCQPDDKIHIRIGLHSGEVIRKDDDLFGHDVNLCSRIESLSPRGGIAASSDLVQSLNKKYNSLVREMGYIKLKNIVHPKQIYKIYLNQDEYLAESDKQLQQTLRDNGIEIVDIDSFTIQETFSAAVLYVNNLGASKDESIAFALTEGLINDFAYINNFRTPGFNEVLHYKNTELKRDDIGRKLQVDNILHGNILREKDSLKLSFEMLDINLGTILWSETWSDHISNSNNIRLHIIQLTLKHFKIEMPKQLSNSLSDEMTNNSNALEAYYSGKYYSDFLKSKKDLQKGKKLLKKAIDLDNNFVEAYYLYGISCQRNGNYDAAETAFLEGKEIAETKNNLQGLAYIYKGFNILYSAWGKWEKSKYNIEKALKIQIQLNNNTVEAMLRLDYAGLLNHLQKTDLSIEQNKQAAKLLKDLEDDRLIGISYAIFNNTYFVTGDFTKSIEYGKKSLAIFRKLGMSSYEAKLLSVIGDAYCRTGDFIKLKEVIDLTKPIIKEFNDIFTEAKINHQNAYYCLNNNDLSNAISYIDQSIEQYNLVDQTQFETQVLIEKLTILIENGRIENINPIISKIEYLINKLKGTFSNDLFTATSLYIDAINKTVNRDNLNSLYKSIEGNQNKESQHLHLVYWYFARTYHSINEMEKAAKCHEKAKKILNIYADNISGETDKINFYKTYFHKLIQEDLEAKIESENQDESQIFSFCPSCGQKNDQQFVFCPQCGNDLKKTG